MERLGILHALHNPRMLSTVRLVSALKEMVQTLREAHRRSRGIDIEQ